MRLALLAAAVALIAGPALAADPVEGLWLTTGKSVKVLIAPCPADPARVCGRAVWLKETADRNGKPLTDTKNPDPARRNDPLMGMILVRDFSQAAPGRWTGGKVYDPTSGRTYDSKMRITPDGTLKLEGCVLVICLSRIWTRTT